VGFLDEWEVEACGRFRTPRGMSIGTESCVDIGTYSVWERRVSPELDFLPIGYPDTFQNRKLSAVHYWDAR